VHRAIWTVRFPTCVRRGSTTKLGFATRSSATPTPGAELQLTLRRCRSHLDFG
jgi:hypothetical protein